MAICHFMSSTAEEIYDTTYNIDTSTLCDTLENRDKRGQDKTIESPYQLLVNAEWWSRNTEDACVWPLVRHSGRHIR